VLVAVVQVFYPRIVCQGIANAMTGVPNLESDSIFEENVTDVSEGEF
jgi:hypothetical protein